jgi:hypothetical protein
MFVKYKKQMQTDIRNIFFRDSDKQEAVIIQDIRVIVDQVMYCLQPAVRSDITLFNLYSDSDLTETVFRSICRCKLIEMRCVIFLRVVLARQKLSKRKEDEQDQQAENIHRKAKTPRADKLKNTEVLSRSIISKKERNAERTKLLDLAMDWNCIEVAKELIFQSSLDNILVIDIYFIFLCIL